MAHRGHSRTAASSSVDALRGGDLLSGTGHGRFDVQMTSPQSATHPSAPPRASSSTIVTPGSAWTSTMQSASRARAQLMKARHERERERHNRDAVLAPSRCEAIAHVLGLGACLDVARCLSMRWGGRRERENTDAGDASAGCAWWAWVIPYPVRWLCCGEDEPLTLAQTHGFRPGADVSFGGVHDLSVEVPKARAQAALIQRRGLILRVAAVLVLVVFAVAAAWSARPVPAPDARWACDTTAAAAAETAVNTWARNAGDTARILASLLGRSNNVEPRHRYLHCPFSTAECEDPRSGIHGAPSSVSAASPAEAAGGGTYRPRMQALTPGFVAKFLAEAPPPPPPPWAASAAAVSVPRGSLGTCAVVGRAWPEDVDAAVRASRGANIDAHDTVVRLQRRSGPGRRPGGEAVGRREADEEPNAGVLVRDAQDEADLMGVRTTWLFMESVATVRTTAGTYARRPGAREADVPESLYLVNVESGWPRGGFDARLARAAAEEEEAPPPPETDGFANAHASVGENHVGRRALLGEEEVPSEADPAGYEGTAARFRDAEIERWASETVRERSREEGTTEASEYRLMNEKLDAAAGRNRGRGNPWDPRPDPGARDEVETGAGDAGGGAFGQSGATLDGAARSEPFGESAAMAEEEESAKDAEEERDRWVEGVTGGPVGSELDQDGGVYGPDVIFNKAWGKPILRVSAGGLHRVRAVLREAIERLAPAPAAHVMRAGYGLVDAADAAEEAAVTAAAAAAAAEVRAEDAAAGLGGRKGGRKGGKKKGGKGGKEKEKGEKARKVQFVDRAGAGLSLEGEERERVVAEEAEENARAANVRAAAAAEAAAEAQPELPTLLVLAHALQLSGLCTRVDAYGLGTPEDVPTYDTSKPREQWRAVRDLLVAGQKKEKFCAVN